MPSKRFATRQRKLGVQRPNSLAAAGFLDGLARRQRREPEGGALRLRVAAAPPPPFTLERTNGLSAMPQGTVKFFDSDRGFGFVSRDDGADDVFIHIRALHEAGMYGVAEGDQLQFELRPSRNKRGREEACEVRKIGSRCV